MANTVYTAPLAIVMVGTTVIGKMKNIRVSETIRRARVTGLGRLNASEVPAVEFTGTLNASFYTVNLEAHELTRRALNRKVGTTTNFVNTVVLQDIGLTIKLMRKVGDPAFPATPTTDLGQDPTRLGVRLFCHTEDEILSRNLRSDVVSSDLLRRS